MAGKRVLLAQPFSSGRPGLYPPYGLACVAAYLRDIAAVEIIDGRSPGGADIVRRARQWRPQYVGISLPGVPAVPAGIALARRLRRACPRTRVIFGGHGASCLPQPLLEAGDAYAVVRGEGESSARLLVAGAPRPEVLGVSFIAGGRLRHNRPQSLIDNLDRRRPPAFDLLRPSEYAVALVESSRGCPHACSFCVSRKFYGGTYRTRSPAAVVSELRLLLQAGGPLLVTICDDNFTHDVARVRELCRRLIEARLPLALTCISRADSIARHPGMVALMARAGFVNVSLGVESLSDEVLRRVRKGSTAADARRALDLLRRHGIFSAASLIVGFPGDTAATFRQMGELVRRADPDVADVNFYIPLPGLPDFDRCRRRGLLLTEDWRRYHGAEPLVRLPDLTPRRALSLYRRLRREFFFRPSWIADRLTARPGGEYRCLFARGTWRALWDQPWFAPRSLELWGPILLGYAAVLERRADRDDRGAAPRQALDGAILVTTRRGRYRPLALEFRDGRLVNALTRPRAVPPSLGRLTLDSLQVVRAVYGPMTSGLVRELLAGRATFDGDFDTFVRLAAWTERAQTALDVGRPGPGWSVPLIPPSGVGALPAGRAFIHGGGQAGLLLDGDGAQGGVLLRAVATPIPDGPGGDLRRVRLSPGAVEGLLAGCAGGLWAAVAGGRGR